jgi:hypothetical protein
MTAYKSYTMPNCREMPTGVNCMAEKCGDKKCVQFKLNKERLNEVFGNLGTSYYWIKMPNKNHCWVSPSKVISDPPNE